MVFGLLLGTGKSGVVDAFDFLFSGNIQRLSGTGTKGPTLDAHGKHIDDDLSDANVSCVLELANGNLVKVKRTLSDKNLVLVDGDKDDFESVKIILEGGQFQLTRREILKFIVCEGQTRSTEIQTLLDVKELDKLRKDLTNIVNDLTCKETTVTQTTEFTLADIDRVLKIEKADSVIRRKKINELREVLKKPTLTTWSKDTSVTDGIQQPESKETDTLRRKEFLADIDSLDLNHFEKLTDEEHNDVPIVTTFTSTIHELDKVSDVKQRLENYDLLQLGIAQVTDDGLCPLCDTKWDKHELVAHIQRKVELAKLYAVNGTRTDRVV